MGGRERVVDARVSHWQGNLSCHTKIRSQEQRHLTGESISHPHRFRPIRVLCRLLGWFRREDAAWPVLHAVQIAGNIGGRVGRVAATKYAARPCVRVISPPADRPPRSAKGRELNDVLTDPVTFDPTRGRR